MSSYTLAQAQQAISADQAMSEEEAAASQRLLDGTWTNDDLHVLINGGLITINEATGYIAKRQAEQAKAAADKLTPDPLKPVVGGVGGLYPYNPATGEYSPYPGSSEVGNTSVEGGHPIDTYADPQTGLLYNAKGTLLPKYLQVGTGGGGGGGSYGSSAEYLQAQQAQRAMEFQQQQALAQQQASQGYIQDRANYGINLGGLVRGLANDSYNRALDPGNYPAYLAASAGLPQGSGSPISALIGQGVQIQPPPGGNPLADPRLGQLISQGYEYAQPGALQTVQGIAAANNGTLPQAFYDYTGTQAPAHAQGGSQMLNGPVVGIPQGQLMPGQTPQFLAGEAGPERIDFSPMHTHETSGMPIPHQHDGAHAAHEHMGSMIRYEDGGTAITGVQNTPHQLISAWNAYHPDEQKADNTFTPAEGTAMSLGKALQPLGYVPQPMIQQLMQGNTPTPGSVDEATLSRLPPSLRALLQAQIRSALGGAGVQDYNFQLQQNALPGLATASPTVAYSG